MPRPAIGGSNNGSRKAPPAWLSLGSLLGRGVRHRLHLFAYLTRRMLFAQPPRPEGNCLVDASAHDPARIDSKRHCCIEPLHPVDAENVIRVP